MRKKLTNSMVEAFTGDESGSAHPVLWCGELRGFGLRYATKTGTRTYIYHGRVKGSNVQRTISIGRHLNPWKVDQARTRALTLKAQMLDGIDPVAEQEQKQAANEQRAELDKAQAVTLRRVMEHYLEHRHTKHGPLRPKTKDSLRETITRYLASWLDAPMATTVTREACLTRFVEMSKTTPAAANQTMVYLRGLVNHARRLHAKENGEPTIFAVNVVTLMFELRKPNLIKPRTGRIPKDRIGHVWAMLQDQRANAPRDVERIAADLVCFQLMTGTRLSESSALMRTDVNLDAKTVTLRADVVKNHHELTVPLSPALHEILSARMATADDDSPAARRRRRARSNEYVFPSFGTKRPFLTDARATMAAVSKVAGIKITPHDLRRSYEDILRFSKCDPDERRLLLNHISGDVHQLSYSNDQNAESLRPSVDAAAAWVLEQARIASAPNVLQFPTKTA
jgi:site-specific recombinase XerD